MHRSSGREDIRGTGVRVLLLAVALLVFRGPSDGAGETAGKDEPAATAARITFQHTEYDFGEATPDKKVEHVFSFQNSGNAELLIRNVRSSCGCTGALTTTREVPPGGKGEIRTTFNGAGYDGDVRKTVTVESNDPRNPEVLLVLKGKVTAPVRVMPRHLSFGTVSGDGPRQSLELEIECRQATKSCVREVRSESPWIVIAQKEADGARAVYTVSLTEEVPAGVTAGEILIRTSDANMPLVKVPLHAFVQGRVAVSPRVLSLGRLFPGKPVTRSATLTKTGAEGFRVETVRSTSDRLSCRVVTEKEGERYRLEVTYTPDEQQTGRIIERATVAIQNGKKETVEVPVYGIIEGHAETQAP